MVKRYTLAAFVLFWLLCVPTAHAAPQVGLWDTAGAKPYSSSNPIPVTPLAGGSVTQANITNATGNVPNTSTTVTLVAASTHLTIKTDPAAAVLYVDVANGTATTADFRIDPGAGMTWDNLPSMTAIKIIGASATGTYSVTAW